MIKYETIRLSKFDIMEAKSYYGMDVSEMCDDLIEGGKYRVLTKWREECYAYYYGEDGWKEIMGLEWFGRDDVILWVRASKREGVDQSIERMKLND